MRQTTRTRKSPGGKIVKDDQVYHTQKAANVTATMSRTVWSPTGHPPQAGGRPQKHLKRRTRRWRLPLRSRLGVTGATPLLVFGRKFRIGFIQPETDRYMTNVYTAVMQETLDIAGRKRNSDMHHYGQAHDLWRCFELTEWPK